MHAFDRQTFGQTDVVSTMRSNEVRCAQKLENLAIAMSCNLRPTDAASVLIRFDFVAHGKFEVAQHGRSQDFPRVGARQRTNSVK